MADRLGYSRFWVSEHHNTNTLAGSTPEVLIAHLGNHTQRIRLGSGGVMLPHYSALKVAENFRMLESLFPGRIDLGMGRAPGGDRLTAHALNPSNTFSEQDFVEQLMDLQAYLRDDRVPETIHERVMAIPQAPGVPELWLLSSSGQSGLFAAHLGMAFSFAQFINGNGGRRRYATTGSGSGPRQSWPRRWQTWPCSCCAPIPRRKPRTCAPPWICSWSASARASVAPSHQKRKSAAISIQPWTRPI
ncbi:MsnO8 family LLM class oxidoreductase [Hymenobacter humi]|uniref:MsnO8 family LLM class oxidoreductase n=1 Tax=Hymenobacter humi TaxID=1411620 RepID=A0ABW2UAI4_9BACT